MGVVARGNCAADTAKIEAEPDKKLKIADTSAKTDDSAGDADLSPSVDPTIMGTPADYQMTRAVDMLRGVALYNGRLIN